MRQSKWFVHRFGASRPVWGLVSTLFFFFGCSAQKATVHYETTKVVFTDEPLFQTGRTGSELDSLVTEEFGLSWKTFKKAYCKYGDPSGPVSYSETARKIGLITNLADSLNRYYLPFILRVNEVRILYGAENIYHTQHYQGKISIPLGVFVYYPEEFAIRSLYHEFGHAFYWALPLQKMVELWGLYRSALEIPGFLTLFKDSDYHGNRVHDGHPGEAPGELFASAFSIVNLNKDEFSDKIQSLSIEEYRLARQIQQLVKNTSTRSDEQMASSSYYPMNEWQVRATK